MVIPPSVIVPLGAYTIPLNSCEPAVKSISPFLLTTAKEPSTVFDDDVKVILFSATRTPEISA